MTVVNLKEDIDANAAKQRCREKKICSLEENCTEIRLLEKIAHEQCSTKRNKENNESDGNEKRLEKSGNEVVFRWTDCEKLSKMARRWSCQQDKNLWRVEWIFLRVKMLMQMNVDKALLYQGYLQHLSERKKSLECGPTRKIIWKIDILSSIFDIARCFSSRKHEG